MDCIKVNFLPRMQVTYFYYTFQNMKLVNIK